MPSATKLYGWSRLLRDILSLAQVHLSSNDSLMGGSIDPIHECHPIPVSTTKVDLTFILCNHCQKISPYSYIVFTCRKSFLQRYLSPYGNHKTEGSAYQQA